MKVKITLEIQLDENLWGKSEEDKKYIEDNVFITDGTLILHTNDIGDYVGEIKAISEIKWLDCHHEKGRRTSVTSDYWKCSKCGEIFKGN